MRRETKKKIKITILRIKGQEDEGVAFECYTDYEKHTHVLYVSQTQTPAYTQVHTGPCIQTLASTWREEKDEYEEKNMNILYLYL